MPRGSLVCSYEQLASACSQHAEAAMLPPVLAMRPGGTLSRDALLSHLYVHASMSHVHGALGHQCFILLYSLCT